MALTVTQKHLFSFFGSVNVVSLKGLYEIYEEIVTSVKNDKPASLEQLYKEISLINQAIKNYDLEIVASIDELTCQELFILVNTTNNSIAKKAKFYDKHTTQYFSRIVRDIVLSEKGHLSEVHCLNVSSKVGISKNTAQMTLEKLLRDKWIVAKEGIVSLSMRSVVELEHLIKKCFPDEVKYCPFCKLMLIQGYICAKCKLRCHYACLKKFFTFSKSNCICPKCKEVWSDVLDFFQSNDDISIKKEKLLVSSHPVLLKKKRKSFREVEEVHRRKRGVSSASKYPKKKEMRKK